ncbi:MAG: hypothetical protein IJX64_01775 [Clostridia bacterium]|nr:hypothetical protein [Clostridia bacterium]
MKAKKILYGIVTAVILAGVIYVDVMPDPNRGNNGDYGMWVFEVAPVLLFLHGLFSGFMLHGKKQKITYLVCSALSLTVLFFCTRLYMEVSLSVSLLTGLAAAALFLPCICVDLLIATGIAHAYRGIRKNKNLLRYKYEK